MNATLVPVLRPGRAGGARATGRLRRAALRVAPLPLIDVHPHVQLAAEATEATANQDKFSLNADRFVQDMRERTGQPKVISDVDSADLSGVSATPTFFINGRRHHGAYNIDTLSAAVRAARARVLISSPPGRRHAPRRGWPEIATTTIDRHEQGQMLCWPLMRGVTHGPHTACRVWERILRGDCADSAGPYWALAAKWARAGHQRCSRSP
jgi:hypothetical protein